MEKNTTLKEFKIYLKNLGYSPVTVRTLEDCVKEFLHYHHPIRTSQISSKQIKQFYEWLHIRPNRRKAGGLSQSRIHHFMYSLRLFFNYREQTGAIKQNPMSGMVFPSPESTPREILTRQEVQELYHACETLRDRAILGIIYGCGLRKTEAELVNISDIHFRNQLLYVRKGKGKKRRVIPMAATVTEDLKNYFFEERSFYIKTTTADNQQSFILNKNGDRMKGERYYSRVKDLIQLTNNTDLKAKQIGLHSLRHSIATHLLENGLPVEYVRDFLGHQFLETTKIYTRVNQHQLKNIYENSNLPEKEIPP